MSISKSSLDLDIFIHYPKQMVKFIFYYRGIYYEKDELYCQAKPT